MSRTRPPICSVTPLLQVTPICVQGTLWTPLSWVTRSRTSSSNLSALSDTAAPHGWRDGVLSTCGAPCAPYHPGLEGPPCRGPSGLPILGYTGAICEEGCWWLSGGVSCALLAPGLE